MNDRDEGTSTEWRPSGAENGRPHTVVVEEASGEDEDK